MIALAERSLLLDPACPINWQHPLNRGLVLNHAVAPNPGWRGGALIRDLVRGGRTPHDGAITGPRDWRTRATRYPSPFGGHHTDAYIASPISYVTATLPAAVAAPFTLSYWTTVLENDDAVSLSLGGVLFTYLRPTTPFFLMSAPSGFTGQASTFTPSLNVPTWYGVTYNGGSAGDVRLYVNGVDVTSGTATATSAAGASSTLLYGATNQFSGLNQVVGPLRYYNRILSAAEMGKLWKEECQFNSPMYNWLGATRAYSIPAAGGGTVYTLTAAAGTFALTGEPANLVVSRKVTTAAGSFTLTGEPAGLYSGRRIPAAVGTFTLSGQAAGLVVHRALTAAAGVFALAGQSVTMLKGQTLSAGPGSFAVTGEPVNLVTSRKLTAAAGSFSLVGQGAGLLRNFRIAAAAGSFLFTGESASLVTGRRLSAGPGSFVLTGEDATLRYTGAPTVSHMLLLRRRRFTSPR